MKSVIEPDTNIGRGGLRANAGKKKGSPKTGGRQKGSVNRTTAQAREAIAQFVDGNAHRLEQWLDDIAAEEGSKSAFLCFSTMLEYHVPKLARTEHTGANDGPIELVVKWQDGK